MPLKASSSTSGIGILPWVGDWTHQHTTTCQSVLNWCMQQVHTKLIHWWNHGSAQHLSAIHAIGSQNWNGSGLATYSLFWSVKSTAKYTWTSHLVFDLDICPIPSFRPGMAWPWKKQCPCALCQDVPRLLLLDKKLHDSKPRTVWMVAKSLLFCINSSVRLNGVQYQKV